MPSYVRVVLFVVNMKGQCTYGSPNFMMIAKSVRGYAMNVKLVKALEHTAENVLRAYTMPDERSIVAINIVQTIHWILTNHD